MEDDVIAEFIFNQLDAKDPDPRKMQINLTGFLNGKNARIFMGELWALLNSAQKFFIITCGIRSNVYSVVYFKNIFPQHKSIILIVNHIFTFK